MLVYTINPDTPSIFASEEFGGWNLPNHLVFFLSGFLLASSEKMQASICRLRWISLVLGVVSFIAGGAILIIYGEPQFGTPMNTLILTFSALICWSWSLAILGFGMGRLNFRTPVLDYANDAVMPFYVLHQSVLIVVGYYVTHGLSRTWSNGWSS